MIQKDNILQELNELNSTLATINRQNVYTVPAGYFDGLAAQVLNRIKAMDAANAMEELSHLSPTLSYTSKLVPYNVPEGYFDSLAERAIQAVRVSNDYLQKESFGQTAKEEIETLSPLLSGLKKEIPYSIPQGYFEELTKNISKEENKPSAKIISLTSRKWFRYAAAAVVVGIIAITGFLVTGNEKEPGVKALAKLSRDVKKMDETQKDKLMDFIDAGLNGQETVQANPGSKSEIKDLLQGISEEELTDFQEQTEDIQEVLTIN